MLWLVVAGVLLAVTVTSKAQNVTLHVFTDSGSCFGSSLQINATANNCTFLYQSGPDTFAARVTCNRYFSDRHIIRVFDNTNGSDCLTEDLLSINQTSNGACLFINPASVVLAGCPPVVQCNNTVSDWTAWTFSCGDAQRTRTVNCSFNDGFTEACTTCQSLETVDSRRVHCVQQNETISTDYCNTNITTCSVSLDNAGQFNTPSGFWKNSIFTNGWTMQIRSHTANGSVAYYTLLPELISLDDITITSGDSISMSNLVVASHSLSISNGLGTCSLFRFTGNRITIKNMNIIIPASCYTLVPLGANLIFHGSAIQFAGVGMTMSNIMVSGSVVALLMDTRVSIGNVSVTNVGVGDQFLGPIRTSTNCWFAHIFANEGVVSINTVNDTCVTTVSYGSTALKVYTTNGKHTDATMVITNKIPVVASPSIRSNRVTNAIGSLIPFIVLAVIAGGLIFYVAYMLLEKNQILKTDAFLQTKLRELLAERKVK